MGKFSDALKMAETSARKEPAGEVTEKYFQVPRKQSEEMRIDTEVQEVVHSSSLRLPGKLDSTLVSLLNLIQRQQNASRYCVSSWEARGPRTWTATASAPYIPSR